jgi:SAM-dependent methyltransferase
VARLARGPIYAFVIERDLVKMVRDKAQGAGLRNVVCEDRESVVRGIGLPDSVVDYAVLFNILHAERPYRLLSEASRVLRPGGRLGLMHWNYDPGTPRGPYMSIRPRPEQCRAWAEAAGFRLLPPGILSLPP